MTRAGALHGLLASLCIRGGFPLSPRIFHEAARNLHKLEDLAETALKNCPTDGGMVFS
jgi:hypothetical protein